jgi:ring-1,2-phenylacetyl-CoA epoxidase subunit PaaD
VISDAAILLGDIESAVRKVEDPEIPITLVDLGVLRSIEFTDDSLRVVLRPTRLGCPARDRMERDIAEAARRVLPAMRVEVEWEAEPWSESDVTSTGRSILRAFGYADGTTTDTECPYCGSADVRAEGSFGGALCKLPWTCRACGSTFDVLRSTAVAAPVVRRTGGASRG